MNASYSKTFLKEAERAQKRGKDIDKLMIVIDMLLRKESLPQKYKNHKLKAILRIS